MDRDQEQQMPMPGGSPVGTNAYAKFTESWDRQRKKGHDKYGTELMTFNGRDAYRDAMEEAVDLVQYITQIATELNETEAVFTAMYESGPEYLNNEFKWRARIVYNNIKARQLRSVQVGEAAIQESP